MENVNFLNVTELAGDSVSRAQLSRFYQRYGWAGTFCEGKDVLEVACGTGPGLGYLASKSKSFAAGDLAEDVLNIAKSNYGNKINLVQFSAENIPFPNNSFDLIILFEAIYYIPNARLFLNECKRLLRPGGMVLIATANCSLYDFNPSPYSTKYFTVLELTQQLNEMGFEVECFAGSPVNENNLKSKIIRKIKKIAVTYNLIPGSMEGKKLLKKIFFGKLIEMPKLLTSVDSYVAPIEIDSNSNDIIHQVIYFKAKKK